MRKRRRFNISIEDEAKLEKVFQINLSFFSCIGLALIIIIILVATGAILLAVTPARSLLPGYMTQSERINAEENHMRLDSLIDAYTANQIYLDNILTILGEGPKKMDRDSIIDETDLKQSRDTLMGMSDEEKKFIDKLNEQEQYAASMVAPHEAATLRFSPVSDNSVISPASKSSIKPEIILAKGDYVGAIADGIVLAVNNSFEKDEKTSIIIQHPRGFVSRYSHLDHSIVRPGDNIIAGEAIAVGLENRASETYKINLEMWHNGTRLIPANFIEETESNISPVVDRDIGRGRL